MRGVICAAPLLAFVSLRAVAAEKPQSGRVTVDQAVALAIERNVDIKSAEAQVRAAAARRAGAGLLLPRNPDLSIEAGPRRRAEQAGTMDLEVALDQSIPIAGQRGLRIEVADALTEAARARLVLRRIQVVAAVREAYARALAAGARLAVSEQADRLSQDLLRAAEERYKEGASSRIEVNTARVERARALRDLVVARKQQIVAKAALGLVTGVSAAPSWTLIEPARTSTATSRGDVEAEVTNAVERHPTVVAARADVAAARSTRTLAGREAVPDVRVGASYSREEEASIIKGRLSIGLPVFDRRQAERGVAEAQRTQAEQLLAASEREIALGVRTALLRLRAAEDVAQSFAGDVLKAMDENLALISEGYRAGKIDLFQLLLIRRDTLEARRGYIESLEELRIAEAELARATGATK